jgi:hypothetical protein
MKKILFAIILFSSCTFTKQQKAEKLIKDYLNIHLNDPHSYESVSFGKIDSAYSTLKEDSDYLSSNRLIDQYQTDFDEWKAKNPDFDGISDLSDSQTKYFIKMNDFYSNEKIKEMKLRDSIALKFKPSFKGWYIIHTYRAKNGFGALRLDESGFTLNKACDSILNVSDVKD